MVKRKVKFAKFIPAIGANFRHQTGDSIVDVELIPYHNIENVQVVVTYEIEEKEEEATS